MAKKNTLSDLNEFLKNQPKLESDSGATSEHEFLKSKGTFLAKIEKKSHWNEPKLKAAAEKVSETIKDIATKEGLSNHQLLIASAIFEIENREALEASDLLLLNTLLYLQHTEK